MSRRVVEHVTCDWWACTDSWIATTTTPQIELLGLDGRRRNGDLCTHHKEELLAMVANFASTGVPGRKPRALTAVAEAAPAPVPTEWSCPVAECDEVFTSRDDRRKHMGDHTDIPCTVAGCKRTEPLASFHALQMHMRRSHPDQFVSAWAS